MRHHSTLFENYKT